MINEVEGKILYGKCYTPYTKQAHVYVLQHILSAESPCVYCPGEVIVDWDSLTIDDDERMADFSKMGICRICKESAGLYEREKAWQFWRPWYYCCPCIELDEKEVVKRLKAWMRNRGAPY